MIHSISAVALGTHDMAAAVAFYRLVGMKLLRGGEAASFTTFEVGTGFLNLTLQPDVRLWTWWGRIIFYDSDVDGLHAKLVSHGHRPDFAPRDAGWGERYFHISGPDGHELSFAWPLA